MNTITIFTSLLYFICSVTAPSIEPLPWLPTINTLNFCLIRNNQDVYIPLINIAFNSINIFLVDGNYTPLYLNFQENEDQQYTCQYFVNITSTVNSPAAYCTRTSYLINREVYYQGCNITINICSLQTSASFYNVLLHELLHVVGINHPNPPVPNSVISYAVSIDRENNTLYDTEYIALSSYDIQQIDAILQRDFPLYKSPDHTNTTKYVPKYPPYRHISGLNTYIINYKNDVEPCLIKIPTSNPTFYPTSKPTPRPTKPAQQTTKPTTRPTKHTLRQKILTVYPTFQINSKTIISFPPKINIKNRINPNINIDTSLSLNTNFNIENEISPVVSINRAENQQITVVNDISPVVNVGR
jgi:hypothetical protein